MLSLGLRAALWARGLRSRAGRARSAPVANVSAGDAAAGGERGAAVAAAGVRTAVSEKTRVSDAALRKERTDGLLGTAGAGPGGAEEARRLPGSRSVTPPRSRSLSPVQAQLRAEAPCWEAPRALVSGRRVPRAEPRAGRSEDGGPAEACRRHPEAEPAARLRVGAEGRQRHLRGRVQGEAPARPASVGRPRDAPDHSVRPGSGPDPAARFRAPWVPSPSVLTPPTGRLNRTFQTTAELFCGFKAYLWY